MAHTFTNVAIHALFSTKQRRANLDAALRSELFPYMGGIIMRSRAVAQAGWYDPFGVGLHFASCSGGAARGYPLLPLHGKQVGNPAVRVG
jgi:hypothetical protein